MTFVCDSITQFPTDLRDMFGKRIRVRILSRRDASAHETLIFDENRSNTFRTGTNGDGRFLYARFLTHGSIQTDSTTNAVVLDSTKPVARVNFVTSNNSSDFPNFALGYGLYYFGIEYPYKSCALPPDTPAYYWDQASWIFDFRDSRFSNAYGVDSAGEMVFSFAIRYKDVECGPPKISVILTAPGRTEPLHLVAPNQFDGYDQNDPVPVQLIFEQSSPEFDFHIDGDLYRGLDTTLKQQMFRTLELSHSVCIDTGIVLDQNWTFTITNTYDGHGFLIERDSVVISLKDACNVSALGPMLSWFKILGSPSNRITISSEDRSNPTGFLLHGLPTVIDYADMTLVRPIVADGPSGNLSLRNTGITREERVGGEPLLYLDQPFAMKVASGTFTIDSCVFTIADSTVSGGSGILLENVGAGSRMSNCVIERFPGHGIEIVDGPYFGSSHNPRVILCLEENTIRKNRLNGVHIRGAMANPYFLKNYVRGNGWFGENTVEDQALKFDGVNVQTASGIFQNNIFDSSGAYGIHAAFNAKIFSNWKTGIQYHGGNCFRTNYYNIGGSGNSLVEFGRDSAQGQNSFSNPRSTWSDLYHATLRHTCVGELRGNAWENPYLSADPYPIYKIDSATSFEKPEYGGSPIECVSSLSPGGARNDSIASPATIDSIRAAVTNGDWNLAADLSLQLLSSCSDAFSATFAATTLVDALRETDDPAIPSSLGLIALDTAREHASIAANYSGMKAFAFAGEHDSCMALAEFLAQRFPYSEHWRNAQLTMAFLQNDYYGNPAAAEDIIEGVLQYDPDDAQTIGAFYSVKGMLPGGFSKRTMRETQRNHLERDTMAFAVYPNPAADDLTLRFRISESGVVQTAFYDLSGNEVAVLSRTRILAAGEHAESFSVSDVPSGYYHVMLRVNGRTARRLVKIEAR